MRMRPGGVIPAHRHEREEEFIILEGECYIGTHRLVAGDVHIAAAGSWHEPVTTESGVVVLLQRGISASESGVMTYWAVTETVTTPRTNCAMRLSPRNLAAAGLVSLLPSLAFGGGIPTSTGWLEEVVVSGKLERLGGDPASATVGIATSEQLDLRPVLRTGELLEVVPGLVVTQHSGSGKANQYFLRGFNLDHGTDLATSVDGVPVNMPTHAHGQGYTDINFVIPELIESIEYRKGTYYADTGNFSAAGAVNLRYRSALDAPFVSVESGDDDYLRGLFAASPEIGGGTLLMALEHSTTNGPWLLEERFHKTNALLRYSHETAGGRFAVTAQGYDGEWRSTDQIPLRAVQSGALDRFGFVDPTNGGESHRYTLAADWYEQLGEGRLHAQAYAIDYRLDLFSNFTYAVDTENGDQFEQFDDRRVYGGQLNWTRPIDLMGLSHELDLGLELRRDDIDTVGLYKTVARTRIDTTREDDVTQSSYSVVFEPEDALERLRADGARAARGPVRLRREQQPRSEFRQRRRCDRQPEVLADPRPLARDGVLLQRRQGLSQQRRARHDDPRRSNRRRDAGRPRRSAGRCTRRRHRSAHRGAAEPAADRGAVDAEARFRAAVRRRRRHHRAEPRERAARHRSRRDLEPGLVADSRRGSRVVAFAVQRRVRSGGRSHSGRGRERRVGRALRSIIRAAGSAARACATSARRR